jgi:hypothetical protein
VRRKIKELRQDREETLEAIANHVKELALNGYSDASEAIIETVAAAAFLVSCANQDTVFHAL